MIQLVVFVHGLITLKQRLKILMGKNTLGTKATILKRNSDLAQERIRHFVREEES